VDWRAARGIAFERDEGKCQKCCLPAADVHHRIVRGFKACNDPEVVRGLAGLVSACRRCHMGFHLFPQEGYDSGFLVHSWDDPEEIPLRPSGKVMIWLSDEGGRKVVSDWQF
jgi:hypothetical protein